MHSLTTLNEWLFYLESIHPVEIDMGLERISIVAKRLNIQFDQTQIITVAGTNGKGTTCAFIENALIDEGYQVGVYSSPHIERFNERLRFNKQLIADQPLVEAFEKIENARQDVSLTYYEYTTLAALMIAQQKAPDVLILEVGLGGRLDATNMIDCDIAVITTIDLDHQTFLGNTRAAIGMEKAGIIRANKPVVIGDLDLPDNVLNHCHKVQAKVLLREQEFSVIQNSEQWQWHSKGIVLTHLNTPYIPQDNVATALTVLDLLAIELDTEKVNQWISQTRVEGRTEVIKNTPLVVLDVGHNPHAARYLAKYVTRQNKAKVHAVCAMLGDKDIESTLKEIVDCIDDWYVAPLNIPRGADVDRMSIALKACGKSSNHFDNVVDAYKMALDNANNNDMILVFGSFFTVAEIKKSL